MNGGATPPSSFEKWLASLPAYDGNQGIGVFAGQALNVAYPIVLVEDGKLYAMSTQTNHIFHVDERRKEIVEIEEQYVSLVVDDIIRVAELPLTNGARRDGVPTFADIQFRIDQADQLSDSE